MITRKPYKADEAQPVYHHNITFDGKLLQRNQLVTLERGIGYPAGKYRFQYAEERPDGSWCLVFFGPVARKVQRYRTVWPQTDELRTIHRPVGTPESFG